LVGRPQRNQRIKKRKLTWKQFERYFCKAYLFEKYYDEKIKEFSELNMGKLTLEAHAKRLMELLRYVPYLKDEKEINASFSQWVTTVIPRLN
jgi:hypothetical protein